MKLQEINSNYLKLENISKNYEDKTILKNINLNIEQSEFVCIVGNSSSGKSTLLKVMAGIETPSTGKVYIKGVERTKSNTARLQKLVGFVFQQDCLMEWRTVDKNVCFPLEIIHRMTQRLLKQNYADKIDDTLNVVGLGRFRLLFPGELSGGMRMRAAIARALVSNSEILFLDQPFDALDAITRKTLEIDMLRLWEKTGKTIVLITNSLEEAVLLGNRVLVISPGSGSIDYKVAVNISYEERMEALYGNLKNTIVIENLKQEIRHKLKTGKEQYSGGKEHQSS
jgi:NitT/TauT family transport system ATP-binding protein